MTTRHVGGVRSEDYWEYQLGEHVMTIDGFPGVVEQVEDGPIAGAENYVVKLDNGMGGGNYSASMLARMPTSRSAAGVHLAVEDYPELGGILDERPDPGKMTFMAAKVVPDAEPEEGRAEEDPGGSGDQPHSCSYCGSTDFKDLTDNGRVRQATCATCGGTMSAHEGAQWTPELIGDPSNHPSPTVDPRSGASGAGDQAGINDFIDFDSRVSTTASLAAEHGISHVYRGVHGPYAASAAEANRSGDLGSGMYGKGFYTTSSPDLATGYAQAHSGDRTGVFMHGQVHPDASVSHLDDVPKHVQHGTETDWARENGHDVLTDGVHTHIVTNPHAIAWDPKNYDIGEAHKKFNRWGEDYDANPPDLHTASLAGHDWCTWRREARCTFPGDSTAVSMAIPQDRGPCPWETPWQQQVCPISEPGPMALMQAKGHRTAATPAGPCPTCKGAGTTSWRDEDPDWKGEPEDNPGVTLSAPCDDCDGKGHVPAVSDEEEAYHRKRFDDAQARSRAEHLEEKHPPGKEVTFADIKGCGPTCPVAKEWTRRRDSRQGQLNPEPGAMLRTAARDADFGFHVTASWADVQRKAKRIRSEGGVTIVIASNDGVGGHVKGDHGTYEALLVYRPGTHKVADWTCGCKWAAYAFERSPGFQRFEGRKCSHALALQFEAQSQGMFGKEVHPAEPTSRERSIVRYDPDEGAHVFARPYEGSLIGSLVARLREEDADPGEVIGNLVRAGVRHRTAVLLWKNAGNLGPQSCKYCDSPATKAHMWAEHKAYIPTCDAHAQRAVAHLEGQGDEVEAVKELPQKTAEHHEDGERRCPHCGGFIGVEAVEHHRCPHCGAPLGGEGHEHHHEGAKAEEPPGPKVSGIALKAHDTGRVLMLQRGLDDADDPAAGTWEFPGGHHEDGDQSSLHAGIREWEEEVGQEFPLHGAVKHVWSSPNGVYQGHVVVIPSEKDLSMKDGRVVPNPDDPKGDCHEQAAWWDPEHARKIPNLRDEVKANTPWKEIGKASLDATKAASAWDPISNANPQPGRGTSEPAHSNTTNPASTGWAAGEDPDNWNNLDANPEPLTPSLGFDAVLHSEPEPALPTTYGDEDATMRPMEATPADLDPIPDNPPAQVAPDQDANIHLLDGGSSLPNSYHASAEQPESQDVADVIAAFQRTAAGQELAAGASKADDDIAAAAKAHLAKEAAAKFDFAEQQELINEGNDGRKARNLGDLKIEGTHYELLEAALSHQDADPSDIFI
jgi:8-oxo-dGTP pyrophosphatase MutT (NUDIX family)